MRPETFLALVPEWGALIVLVANLLACMALPIPASLVMLGAGAFIATGDLDAGLVWLAALTGAVAGDQIGYQIGRLGIQRLSGRVAGHRQSARLAARAARWLQDRRVPALFLSRWLVSALGPYVNLAAGAARMRWIHFTLPALAGELVWCSLYLGLGWGFARDIEDIADTLGNIAFAASAGVVALLLGRAVLRHRRR